MLIIESLASVLSDALVLLGKAVADRDQVPALTGVLLRGREGEVELTASNGEVGIRTAIPCSVEAQDAILVPARLFSDLMRLVPAQENVSLRAVDGQVGIRFLRSRFDLPSLRTEEFPPLVFEPSGPALRIAAQDLKDLVRRVVYAVAQKDDGRLFTTGIHLVAEDGRLCAAATDNHRLAWASTAAADAGQRTEALVPAKPFAELVRALGDAEVELYIETQRVLLRTEAMTAFVARISTQFPDTSRVVFEKYATTARFDLETLLRAVERTTLVTDQKNARIRLHLDEEGLSVSASSSDAGQGVEALPCELEGSPADLVFGPRYLIDALRNLDGGTVVLQVQHGESPTLLRPDYASYSHFAIVMPLRQNDL